MTKEVSGDIGGSILGRPWRQTWQRLIRVSRPIAWPATIGPFIVGYLLAVGHFNTGFWLGLLYFSLPYNILFHGVNDIYDYDSDRLNPRKTTAGSVLPPELHKVVAVWIVVLNVPFLLYFSLTLPPAGRWAILVSAALCLSYSVKGLRLKSVPGIGALNYALCLAGPLLVGLLAVPHSQSHAAGRLFWPAILAFVIWGMATQAFGAIQDVKPDRKAHSRSIVTALGVKRTATIAFYAYLATSLIAAIAYGPAGVLAGIALSLYALNVSFFRKYRSDAQSQRYQRGWKNATRLNWIVGVSLLQIILWQTDPLGLGKSGKLELVAISLIVLGSAQAILTVANLWLLRRPATARLSDWPRVSILIHAYNQADNINSTLLSAIGQNYPEFEILFADLGSQDNTPKLARSHHDPRLKIIDIPAVPEGWSDDSWAAEQLVAEASGQICILLPADTVLLPNALASIASLIRERQLALAALLPADQNKTWAQRLVLGQNHFLLLGSSPAAWLSTKHSSYELALGGLIAFDTETIRQLGGLETVRQSPLQDLDLASHVKAAGHKTDFFTASDLAISQNHADLRTIVEQNNQRFYPALRFSMPLAVTFVLVGAYLFIAPLVLLAVAIITGQLHLLILTLVALGLGIIAREIVAISSRQSLFAPLLYSVTNLASLVLVTTSMLSYELLKPRWQTRTSIFFD